MHQKELHVVRFSMVVLFSALMIVYLLLYQIKGDDIVDQLSMINTNEYESSIDESLYQDSGETLTEFDQESLLLEEPIEAQTWSAITKETDSLFETTTWNNITIWKNLITTNKIMVLSGTSLWYWRVESVEKLWISYQYALKDQKDIYYVFLDPEKYKFDEIVKSLGWTTYTITTEKDIMENKLFWEKITFINLPEYKGTKVVMLIEFQKALWLIQVDYKIYHGSKWYIKQLFIN